MAVTLLSLMATIKTKPEDFILNARVNPMQNQQDSIKDTNCWFCLGQLVTRMKVIAKHAYKYGLGLPENSAEIALRRIPWQVARHLCLSIFSVDDQGKVKEYSPKDFKHRQKHPQIRTNSIC